MAADKQKKYNRIKWTIGLCGLGLVIASALVSGSKETETILERLGQAGILIAVLMGVLDPSLSYRNRDKPN